MKTTRHLKYETHGSGFWISAETDVELLRREGNRVVIRGPGMFYTCNNAKQPRPHKITMIVPLDAVTE